MVAAGEQDDAFEDDSINQDGDCNQLCVNLMFAGRKRSKGCNRIEPCGDKSEIKDIRENTEAFQQCAADEAMLKIILEKRKNQVHQQEKAQVPQPSIDITFTLHGNNNRNQCDRSHNHDDGDRRNK